MNGPSPFAITTKSSSNNGLLVGLGCEYDWTLTRKYLTRRSMRSHSPCSARWKLRCCYLQYATTSFFHPSLITITKKSPLISRQSKLRPAFWSWLNKERPRYLNFNSYEGFYYLSLCMKGFFYGMMFVLSLLCIESLTIKPPQRWIVSATRWWSFKLRYNVTYWNVVNLCFWLVRVFCASLHLCTHPPHAPIYLFFCLGYLPWWTKTTGILSRRKRVAAWNEQVSANFCLFFSFLPQCI